jgi:hypothetical protein
MPTFQRPQRQAKCLPIVLHSPLNTYHRPCRLQPTDAHAPLHIRCEHLILKSPNRLLERLTLLLESSVSVDLRAERAITKLPEGLVYSVEAHIVSVEESKDVSSDERGRNVDVNDRHGMDPWYVGPLRESRPSTKGLGASRWARM